MDRNALWLLTYHLEFGVALRKESVDRNHTMQVVIVKVETSLSARRAWIEIRRLVEDAERGEVALRKESVDRTKMSKIAGMYEVGVALRKESVDRNSIVPVNMRAYISRSPQGERG